MAAVAPWHGRRGHHHHWPYPTVPLQPDDAYDAYLPTYLPALGHAVLSSLSGHLCCEGAGEHKRHALQHRQPHAMDCARDLKRAQAEDVHSRNHNGPHSDARLGAAISVSIGITAHA